MSEEKPVWADCSCDALFVEGGLTCIDPECAANFFSIKGVLKCGLDVRKLGLLDPPEIILSKKKKVK